MKFTDGYWLVRDGMHPLHPAQAYDVWSDHDSMTVYAPTARIVGRGDTLNRPIATVTYSSPMDDVIRVRIEHHQGAVDAGPSFVLGGDERVPVKVAVDDEAGVLTSGALSVRVHRGAGWQVDFEAAGAVLTSSPHKGIGLVAADDGAHYVHEQLTLGVGELVFGLGERFGPYVKNGQSVDIWNADGGTSSEQAYKNVPFYLTNRGYGVFVNHPELVSFEVGSEHVSRSQFSVRGQSLEYFVIYGPTPKEVLRKYTALTGRPARVPEWSFGLWLSTSFTTSYDEATVSGFIDEMAARDLPLSVFHFDCFWMREFNWCDFEWDPRTFPDPEGMLTRLRARGLKICVWINPYIAQRSPLFAEAAAQGFLLKRTDGSVWQWDHWQAGMGLVDFTNPAAAAWFTGKLDRLLGMGVDAFKTDFGERIPTEGVAWHDGSDPQRMHNYFAQAYNKCVFDLLVARRGEGDAVLFARSATAGGQQLPVHWGGDCYSTFEAMAETLRGGLSLALSGFGFWSHDIGGFEGTPDPTVFKRWLAFGLLSSHSRLHGSGSVRVPWAFDEEAVDITRTFTQLKLSLMPYLARVAGEAHTAGTPMLRPMLLEFPHDRAAAALDTQYLLGDALLVAPVFSASGDVEYYVPEGTWTHLVTGAQVTGPRWVAQRCAIDTLPLLVRPGTVLPIGARTDRPDYDYADGVRLDLYEIADGARTVVEVPALGGAVAATFTVSRTGDRVLIEAEGATGAWSARVVGPDPRTVSAEPGASRLELAL
ncbi:alpha-xylosidase [Pengzhenrongella sicca]|uniref:alpha-D-xyloside xylohydrolase n=1 Tax=Pengzhenrongella sicca TaxID=2819238 RepID=A0A8A4ZGF5_9MICO|nr:alpha-xylosidase [Pengzhenrongella sicca]QTE28738.1 alpha-xylosidase [Pengzhenrongella sicca]